MLRDPQEQLPLSAPLDIYPKALMTASVKQFANGMQTFAYHVIENHAVFMKHIFTSNAPPLQDDASKLLCDIQINVPLQRPLAENSEHFIPLHLQFQTWLITPRPVFLLDSVEPSRRAGVDGHRVGAHPGLHEHREAAPHRARTHFRRASRGAAQNHTSTDPRMDHGGDQEGACVTYKQLSGRAKLTRSQERRRPTGAD